MKTRERSNAVGMKLLILGCCIAAAYSSGIFSSLTAANDVINVCCYSTSPAEYAPNCYSCPTVVYPSALLACCNATTMPRNITYKAAVCMEKNCAINYPRASSDKVTNLLQALLRQTRSTNEEIREDPVHGKVRVVRHVQTEVAEKEIEFGDMNYMNE